MKDMKIIKIQSSNPKAFMAFMLFMVIHPGAPPFGAPCGG